MHYIAHLMVLRSILPNFGSIVRPPQTVCKIMTSVNSSQAPSRFLRLSKAECVLVLITMVWGGTFLLVQHAMTVSGPMFFVGLRFAAAAIIVALFSWRSLRDLTLFELKAGAFIGVAIMLGYGLQTVGLQSIPSSQSAFITALYVPFVPLLQWLVLGRRPGLMPSIGIMLAFTGLMLLSGPSGAALNFSPGEIATLISAIAIAAEIILISNFAGQVDVKRVTVVQLACAQASPGQVRRLRELVARQRACVEQGQQGPAIRLCGEFHLLLASIAGNRPLAQFLNSLVPLTSLVIAQQGAFAGTWREQSAMIEALERRDGGTAVSLMTQHLEHLQAQLS